MKKLLIIVLLLLAKPILAQHYTSSDQLAIDNLNQIIQNQKSHDTALAKAYLDLSEILFIYNPDTVIPLCEQSMHIVKLALRKNYNKTIEKQLRITSANALNNIAFSYGEMGLSEKSLEITLECLEVRKKIGDKKGISISYNNLGFAYQKQEFLEKALDYYNKSLKLQQELKDSIGIARSYNNIAIIYSALGDLENDLAFNLKSLNISQKIGDKTGEARSLNNIGYNYYLAGDFTKALNFCSQSLQLSDQLKDIGLATFALNNLGSIYMDLGNTDTAQYFYEVSLTHAQQLGNPEYIRNASGILSDIYKKQGKGMEALAMHELYIEMKDSLISEKIKSDLLKQEARHEFELAQVIKENIEKEQARVAAEKVQRRDNLQYSIIFLGILLFFGIVLFLSRIKLTPWLAEGLIFFAFLILFEFILVFIDPYLGEYTHNVPMYKLLANATVAVLIFPVHAFMEVRLKRRMLKKTESVGQSE
jgi:tetratricopeptide (TPR) repeat protein